MSEYVNSFTTQLDEYRVPHLKLMDKQWGFKFDAFYLYMREDELQMMKDGLWKGDTIAFRLPGATRGHIYVDENLMIRDVIFYENVCFKEDSPHGVYCLEKEVKKELKMPMRFDLNGEWRD